MKINFFFLSVDLTDNWLFKIAITCWLIVAGRQRKGITRLKQQESEVRNLLHGMCTNPEWLGLAVIAYWKSSAITKSNCFNMNLFRRHCYRKRGEERQRGSCICGFIPQMAAVAGGGPSQCQELGIPFCLPCGWGAQADRWSSTATFSGVLAGSWVWSATARSWQVTIRDVCTVSSRFTCYITVMTQKKEKKKTNKINKWKTATMW